MRMRCDLIKTITELRYVCSPFIPEFMRCLLIRIQDEPFEIKEKTLMLYNEVLLDIEFFRAAPIYLKQRRIIQDLKRTPEELVLTGRYKPD